MGISYKYICLGVYSGYCTVSVSAACGTACSSWESNPTLSITLSFTGDGFHGTIHARVVSSTILGLQPHSRGKKSLSNLVCSLFWSQTLVNRKVNFVMSVGNLFCMEV